MVRSTLLRLTGLLLLASCVGAADQTGSISGKAEDQGGVYLPFPKVRVNGQSNAELLYEANGDAQGRFQLVGVEPGIYTIQITVQGFRDMTVSNVSITRGQESNLGALSLDFAGCDAPGVICDDFGLAVYNDPIHAQGTIEVPQQCSVDIDEGKTTCTAELDVRGTILPTRNPDSDFWLRAGANGETYLVPLNGSSFALNPQTEWSKSGCIAGVYSTREVRIDGLPIGSRVCIRTNRDRYAQVAFFDLVKSRANRVKMAFITWQGKPDWPTLDK